MRFFLIDSFTSSSCLSLPKKSKRELNFVALGLFSQCFGENKEKIITLKISHYCSCSQCCSWHYNKKGQPVFNLRPNVVKKIGQTASGKMAKEGVTLAMPKCFPFGTRITIDGELLGICQDRGGAIIKKGNVIKIDKYVKSHKRALQLGVKYIKVKLKKSNFL